jgi:hypothetical protein
VSRNVGITGEPVHLVEQLGQRGRLAGLRAARLGDEIDVLQHDHRRLQGPGDRARLADAPQRRAGDHDGRHPGHPAQQVAHGVRLAGAGRPVQQHPPLEVLPAGQQRGGVPGDAKDLPLDAVQQVRRQDHLGPVQPRPVQEAEQAPAGWPEHLGAKRDHLTAVHIAVHRQPADLAEHLLDPALVGAGDLQFHGLLRVAAVRAAQQQGVPGRAVRHQVDAAGHAGPGRPAGSSRTGLGGHAADPGRGLRPARPGAGQVGQAELPVPEPGKAEQFVPPSRRGQPGIEADLDIHVIVGGPRRGDHRPPGGVRAEMGEQRAADRGASLGPGRRHRPAQQPPGQPPGVGEFWVGLQAAGHQPRQIAETCPWYARNPHVSSIDSAGVDFWGIRDGRRLFT